MLPGIREGVSRRLSTDHLRAPCPLNLEFEKPQGGEDLKLEKNKD